MKSPLRTNTNMTRRTDAKFARRELALAILAICMTVAPPLRRSVGDESHPRETRELTSIPLERVNGDLKQGAPTVDIAMYLGEPAGQTHFLATNPTKLQSSFARRRR